MKNLLLLAAISFATIGTTISCSSRDDEPTTQPEAQDFTNANYIKNLMQGEWKGIASSSNGISWQTLEGEYNVGYKTTYTISGNNFTYRPFVTDAYATYYKGTFSILPATNTANAVLMMNFEVFYGNKPLTLLDFKDNVITFVQPESGYPEGIRYYKFKKQ